MISLKTNVVLASGRTDDDVVIAWLDEVWTLVRTGGGGLWFRLRTDDDVVTGRGTISWTLVRSS